MVRRRPSNKNRSDMGQINIKEWIKQWLLMDDFEKPEAEWFNRIFILNLWCIWLYRNNKVFREKEVNPRSIIEHQKSLISRITQAYQGRIVNNDTSSRRSNSTNGNAIVLNEQVNTSREPSWSLVIKVVNNREESPYGCVAITRNGSGENFVICRSYTTKNILLVRLLIMREVLIRGKEFGIKAFRCFDNKRTWLRMLQDEQCSWKLQPALADVKKLAKGYESFTLINDQHHLATETQQMARQAASTKISFSWP
ncbi:hypothetical protein PTKIN_Ptkin10aG0163900 [Pterospermum kingtungense]